MTWPEQKKPIQTHKGIEQKAPIHHQVAIKKDYQTTLRQPFVSKDEQSFLDNPSKYINEFSQLFNTALQTPSIKEKWTARKDYIALIIKKSMEHTIKPKEAGHFIMYLNEIKEDLKTKEPSPEPKKEEIFKHGKELLDEFKTKAEKATTINQLKEIDDKLYEASDQYRFVKIPIEEIRHVHNFIEDKIKSLKVDPSVYNELIKNINDAKTSKELTEINNSANKEHNKDKITFDQLQKIYSIINEKETYLDREKDDMIDTWKSIIKSATTKEEIGQVIRETDKSELLTKDQKMQFETLAKKRLYTLFQEVQRTESDMTIVDDFKKKIEAATQINELNELSFQVTDNVANGNFDKAKVIPVDITNLHLLIDEKISQIFKEKIGTIEEFRTKMEESVSKTSATNKLPFNLIMISNEIARLKELNQKVLSSALNQNRKDNLDVLIHSRIDAIHNLKPRPETRSLDEAGKIDHTKIKSMTDALMIGISEFTTKAQLDAFGEKLKILTNLIGSTSDPVITEAMDKLVGLYNVKRRQIIGTEDKPKIITSASEWEIKNLEYEASHKPPEMLPPKEYDDVSKYTWGLTESEAIKKYVEKELNKYKHNVEYTDKQKLELDELEKSKPWVLLTKAQILKQYPEKAEEYTRDLWTYKSKKSDWEKNFESSKYWRSKVEKISSGEWEKINANYLRDQYKKEVTAAISKGKPVPYDVIKQHSEFTKAQNHREIYEKGKRTSHANVSIAIDRSHQENTGVKIKRQDGKFLDEKTADDVIKTISQFQSVVGDITPIMKREDLTIAHTGKKHPYLSTSSGTYHGHDISISLGKNTGSHELNHFLDETAKKRHPDQPLYDYSLIAFAKKNMNGGVYAVERALALSKSKSEEELSDARNLRYMLGTYWQRVEEVWSRLVEQYVSYKTKGMVVTDRLNYSYEIYIKTPAYWDDVTFVNMVPKIEAELNRKISQAKD